MPRIDQTPAKLRPFTFHRLNFTREGEEEWSGDCPFCGRENKFGVNVATSMYKCFVCGESGNSTQFLRKLHEQSMCPRPDAIELAKDRGLLKDSTLESWGCVVSILSGLWIVPGYGINGSVDQLYLYASRSKGQKRMLLSTSEVEHALFGIPLFDPKKSTVYICESWNALALWEVLRVVKRQDDGSLKLTGNEGTSLLADANVIGVPGANVWKARWNSLLAGKRVILMIDNDHPKENGSEGAGIAGARRTVNMLAVHPVPPESIHFLKWGEEHDYNEMLPSGWDVRDSLMRDGGDLPIRLDSLHGLLDRIVPIPEDWITGRSGSTSKVGGVRLDPLDCQKWTELINAWRKAMKWTDDLEHMLSVFLASVLSTETRGEQLWVLAMAPPSSGKTTLCEALAVAQEYIHCKSELNKVYSGFKNDKEGTEDFGIVPKLNNKTLVVMDGDAILKDANRGKILSQYRGLFDGVGRSHYNNGMSRDYVCRFTFILCGTASMREMDASEVGARFINCSFSEHIDPIHEREVNRRVAFRELRNVKSLVNGSAETRSDPDMSLAKRITGGYVVYLRRNAERLLDTVTMHEHQIETVIKLGEFVAFMRARQPKFQDEVVEREFSSRLVAQYVRLTVCLTAVLGKKDVDDEVIARVRRVALDTARGRTLNYARHLLDTQDLGITITALRAKTGESEDKAKELLEFLSKIGVAYKHREKKQFVQGHLKWRLTSRVKILLEEVQGAEGN